MKATIKVLSQDSELNYNVILTVMRSGVNRNKWDYRNVKEYAHTFNSTPILCAYVNGQIADGHNMREVRQPNGEVYYDFTGATAERIVGAISDDPNDIEIRTDESGEWVIAKGKLWTFYNKQLVDHIAKVGTMEVSAETEIFDRYKDGDIEVFTNWRGLGVTILNKKVAPAVPGANIKALQELASEFKELKLRAAAFYKANDEDPDDIKDKDDPDDINDGEPDGKENDRDEIDPEEDQDDDVGEQKQNENKTQKSNEKGETNTVKVLSKRQIAELSKNFDGYKVLSAGQDENGVHVVLLSADGATAVCNMEAADSPVHAEMIHKCEAQSTFTGEGWELAVDTSEILDKMSSAVVTANAQLEAANADLAKANSTIESMQTKEMKRRVSAAKAKALATLNEFNANREQKVESSILTKINEAIENGDFSECENAEGEWTGEEVVCNQVLAACAVEVMKQDKASAMANNSSFVWDKLNGNEKHQNGDVQDLLARNGIRK